ncbi:MAG: type II secretion system protein [Clostridium sp.]|nr:type II secretion system protein [Clostridium sp.]MDU7084052.1 type II secretion system protein [Clostridium sp.]
MIKRVNQKKKKGFSLIELIIVLAVMAIIALIAIPNFTAVRENSKVKADLRTCETIQKTVLMLVSDETITGTEDILYDGETPLEADDVDGLENKNPSETRDIHVILNEALSGVNKPQGKSTTAYKIAITDGTVEVTPES